VKAAGIDLAGSPKNPTGYCILSETNGKKTVETSILHSDEEIIKKLGDDKPSLVAIDAPLTFDGRDRECDRLLKNYGALPPTLPGMSVLARRGTELSRRLSTSFKVIEVYSTASAKILGVYHKDEFAFQKKVMSLDLDGDVNSRFLSRDELDAVVAAITAYLHLDGQTNAVGGGDGVIVIPNV
jgi:predicted nuclease with RNAse H fold